MFTGIVSSAGQVASVTETSSGVRLRISASDGYFSDITHGASVCVNGVCLTVVESSHDGNEASFDVIKHTLSVTTAATWAVGIRVNLERAMCAGDELGGHIVAGHVQCQGEIVMRHDGDIEVQAPAPWGKYAIPKGFVAVDGVSLTLDDAAETDAGGSVFGLHLIPETRAATNAEEWQVGARVNLEFDPMTVAVVKRVETVMQRLNPSSRR